MLHQNKYKRKKKKHIQNYIKTPHTQKNFYYKKN